MKQSERDKGPVKQDSPARSLTTDDNDGSHGKAREVKDVGEKGKPKDK